MISNLRNNNFTNNQPASIKLGNGGVSLQKDYAGADKPETSS